VAQRSRAGGGRRTGARSAASDGGQRWQADRRAARQQLQRTEGANAEVLHLCFFALREE